MRDNLRGHVSMRPHCCLLTADCCLLVPPTEAARGPWQPLQHEEAAEAASGGIAARYILVTTATTT